MRRNRIIYSLIAISSWVICYYYPRVETSFVGYGLMLLPIASLVYLGMIYRTFTYKQVIDSKFITKGEQVIFSFEIHNESIFFYPDVEVTFYGTDSILGQYFETRRMSVRHMSTHHYTYELLCKYRGYYEVGIKEIYLIDFLGLFRVPYKVFDPRAITVYPRIPHLQYFPIMTKSLAESERMIAYAHWGEGSVFSDVRLYQYGDSMRQIHWKQSAKKQELIVKKNDVTTDAALCVVLDLKQYSYEIERRALLEDQMIESVLGLLDYCRREGVASKLLMFEGEWCELPVGNSGEFTLVYERLFRQKFESKMPFFEMMRLLLGMQKQCQQMVLVTHQISYELYEIMHQWVEGGGFVQVIVVHGEEAILQTELKQALEGIGVQVFSQEEVIG